MACRIIAHYASDEDLQNQAVKMIVDNGDISSHMGFFDFCVERLSGHALDASQHQAEKQRCMLFLNTLRDKAKETFEHQRFRGLLRQAAELDELQHDLLPFLLLARDETLLEPYLQKKDELEQLTEEIQYWHKSQAPADNQGAQRLLLVSSGHPYQHSMQEIVAVPNAKGLTVVFSSASSTLNSKSFLTIAPSRSAHGSAARSSKMAASAEGSHEFSGTDRQRWTACDFDGTDSLLFSFETDGAGSAEERYGFMAAVLPMQTDKDADMLGKVTAELESNALMINDELATREVNKSKQTALFPVLLSVMKAYAFSGDSQHAAELLHSVLACLGRSTWLSGHTEVAESLGLQSVATLLEQAMAGSNVPKEEQARTTFEAWLEEIRSAVKSGESGSQDAQQLALPIVAQVGPCLEDLRLQILSDCLSKLQAMHEAIAKASKQYSLVQGRMRYHACDQLSLLIASRLLPEGVRLVQSCHPYAAQPHSFDISLDVSENFEVSEVLVALAPCSCSFDREAKVAIQGQDFWGPRPWALEPVTAKVKAGKQLTIGFQTDGDGSGYPERRWRFLAVLADSRLSCSNLAKAAEKIGETMAEAESPCTNKLYSDAVVAEAALAQAREGCVPQLEEILRLVGSSTHVHEGSEDLCEKVCHSLADMCKWFSGQGLPNYLTQWKHKFPSLEEHVSESKAAVSPKRAEVSDSKKANLTSMFWCFNDDGSMVKHADKLVDQFFYCGRRIEATGEICSTGTQCKFCERFQSEVLEGYTRQNGIVSSFAEEARQDFEEVTDSKQLRRSK